MAEFKDRFRELRRSLDMSQEELANDFNKKFHYNFGKSSISMYENGKRMPEINALEDFADYFKVSLDYLLGRTDIKSKETDSPSLPEEFTSPEEAMEFVLKQNVIMGFGGFDIDTMSEEEVVEFANSLLEHLKLLSLKYRK